MARPGWPERNRAARSFRQLRRFDHVINSDKVFGTHRRSFFASTCLGEPSPDLADAELAADLLIQQTGDDQRHDLPFAMAEGCVTVPERPYLRLVIKCSAALQKCVRAFSINVTCALLRLPSLSPRLVASSRPPDHHRRNDPMQRPQGAADARSHPRSMSPKGLRSSRLRFALQPCCLLFLLCGWQIGAHPLE